MKKLFVIFLALSVLLAFNISSFAYFTTTDYLNVQEKIFMPDMYLTFKPSYCDTGSYAEDLSIYPSDGFYDVIDNDLFESGEYYLSTDSLYVLIQGQNSIVDLVIDQNITLYKILPSELSDRYDYMMSREYLIDEYISSFSLSLRANAVKLSSPWDDVRFYVSNNMNINCSGYYILYYASENGLDAVSVPFEYVSYDDYLYFGELADLEYDFDFCDFVINFSWYSEYGVGGSPASSLNRINFDIPLDYSNGFSWAFNGFEPLDNNDIIINVQSINDFNFLEWLANSVQSFFSVTLFRIGSVPVSVGVCMLVPLSLSILIGFLKKFSGG